MRPTELPGEDRLGIGRFIALLGIVEWLIAGLAYPLSLHLILGGLDAAKYAHFFGSLLVCGMIAAAYPFFSVVDLSNPRPSFQPCCAEIHWTMTMPTSCDGWLDTWGWFLYLAGGVPAAGVMLLGRDRVVDRSTE